MSLPKHKVTLNNRSDIPSGFLKVESYDMDIVYDSGDVAAMKVDTLHRKLTDAVCISAYYIDKGTPFVYLRSCIRPAILCKDYSKTGRPRFDDDSSQWELPTGLIEESELGLDGVWQAASRELKEEVGVFVQPWAFHNLGPFSFTASGMRVFFVRVFADVQYVEKPLEDGSPLEKEGIVEMFALKDCFDKIDTGVIQDSKTIIGLYRLNEHLKSL